jgi:hypothetical protein
MASESLNKFIDQYVNDPAFRESLKKGADDWEQVLQDNGHQLSQGEKQQLFNILGDIKEYIDDCGTC